MSHIAVLRAQLDQMGSSLVAALPSLAIALLILLLTWVVARFAARIADLLISRRDIRSNLKRSVETLVRLGVWLIGGMLAALVAMPGLTPADLLAGVGITAIAFGLAFRGIFENYLAGVLIMVRDKMQVGDYIACKDVIGRLEHIGLRESHISALSGETIIMPNALIFKNPVNILTDNDLRRSEMAVEVALNTDIDRAADVIRRAMEKVGPHEHGRPVEVHAHAFHPSSVELIVRWWGGATPKAEIEGRDRAIRAVKRALGEAGIPMSGGRAELPTHKLANRTSGPDLRS